MSNKKGKTKASNTFYKQGFDDSQKPSPWFRWRRHPYLNSYRLGFKHGLKCRGNNIPNKLIGAICTTTGVLVMFAVWCLMFGLVMFAPALVLLVGGA